MYFFVAGQIDGAFTVTFIQFGDYRTTNEHNFIKYNAITLLRRIDIEINSPAIMLIQLF